MREHCMSEMGRRKGVEQGVQKIESWNKLNEYELCSLKDRSGTADVMTDCINSLLLNFGQHTSPIDGVIHFLCFRKKNEITEKATSSGDGEDQVQV